MLAPMLRVCLVLALLAASTVGSLWYTGRLTKASFNTRMERVRSRYAGARVTGTSAAEALGTKTVAAVAAATAPQRPLRKLVLLVVNNNWPFPDKAAATIDKLRGTGKWAGDMVIALAPDIAKHGKKHIDIYHAKNVTTVLVSDLMAGVNISVPPQCAMKNGISPYNQYPKRQQGWIGYYYKLAILNSSYFRKWDRVLYVDAGMRIWKPIEPFFDLEATGAMLAHTDAWPTYHWKLHTQFHENCDPEMYKRLTAQYDLNVDYFQTTIMLIDTAILTPNVLPEVTAMYHKWSHVAESDQSIFSLYFGNNQANLWRQLPTAKEYVGLMYDYTPRQGHFFYDYHMTKNLF